jgi:hypothetical protein
VVALIEKSTLGCVTKRFQRVDFPEAVGPETTIRRPLFDISDLLF